MRVTKFNYPMEESLINKIDLMIERCITDKAKKDAVLLCEGAEGEGKTTLSVAIAYYVSEKMNVPFSEKNIFFDLHKLIEFAQNTKNQIIIWDEPALQALSTDWAKTVVQDLTRLLMMARKKRHFIIINVTKFYKFNEYVVVDRPLGLIHVYSRKNIYSGRFMFIRKKYLEPLWRDYRFSKKRNYKKYASKKIRGTFPDILNPNYKYNVLSEFNADAYEAEKDKAIAMIGKSDKKEKVDETIKLHYQMATIPGKTIKELAEMFNVTERAIRWWRERARTDDSLRNHSLRNHSLRNHAPGDVPINTLGVHNGNLSEQEELEGDDVH